MSEFLDAAKRARSDQKLGMTAVIDAENGRLVTPKDSYPLAGARAVVETGGQIEKRVTATRLILTGPFALGLRKKNDSRTLYLLVEGDGWAVTEQLKPRMEAQARSFAAQLNAIASSLRPTGDSAASDGGDPLEALQRLGELRDQGVITADEFDTKKAELLGRV